MKNKIIQLFVKKIQKTPLYGRTILVLFFLIVVLKQIFLYKFQFYNLLAGSFQETLSNYLSYFISDFVIFLIIFLFVIINVIIKNKKIRLLNNVLIILILGLFLLDIFTMYFFQSRVLISDMASFSGSSTNDFYSMFYVAIIGVFILGTICFFISQNLNFQKNIKVISSFVIFLFSLSCFFVVLNGSGLRFLPENIFYSNISHILEIKKMKGNTDELDTKKEYKDFFVQKNGMDKKVNIIVVFAESFSAIDSWKIGGVNNNLPYFDKIQEDGISFNNFLANGDVSFLAHISFFLGTEPLKLMSVGKDPYSGYRNYLPPLAQFFDEQGYSSTFLSTASLDFLNQRDFIEEVGFQEIIGEEYFKKEKKYVFGAAPDQKLYEKTLDIIDKKNEPFFVVLQNISFHKPYNTPYGKDQKSALKYADEMLFQFYEKLKETNFFDNGILVIMSDHRKMESPEGGEKETLGESWRARAVATIVGTGIKPNSVNNNIIQHTDFFYGLRSLVASGKILTYKFANDIFGNNQSRERGLMFAPYSQNRKYNIISKKNKSDERTNVAFSRFSEIENINPNAYDYLTAYSFFQYGEGDKNNSENKNNIIVIAHQGSPTKSPENSLEGFILAKKDGADGIEFDVSYTKDGQNIVIHGEKPYATKCRDRINVWEKSFEWLETNCTFSNGEKIKTLYDMLKDIEGLFDYYFLEIKVWNKKYAKEQTLDAINTVKKLGMQDRVIFISYDDTARYILGSHKDIIAGWDTFDINDGNFIENLSHKYFLLPYNTLLQHSGHNLLENIEKTDKIFVTYTVNDTGSLQELYDKGARIIMTDDVPMIKEWMKNKENK